MSKEVQNITLRVDVEAHIKNARNALESLGSAINGKLSTKGSSRFKNEIKNLEKDLDSLQTKATKGFKGSSDAKEVLHDIDSIQRKIGKLDRMNFDNMVDSNVINKLNDAASAIDKISDAKSRVAKNKALKEDLEATKKAIEGIELSSKTSMADFSGAFGKRGSGTYNIYRQQLEKYKKSLAEYEKEKAQAEKIMNSSENGSKEYTKAASDIKATEAEIAKLKSEFKDAFVNTGIKNIDGELKGLKTTISSIDPSAIKNAKSALTDLATEMQNVAKNSDNANIKNFFEGFDVSKIQNMSGDKLQTLFDKFKTMASELGDEEVTAKTKQIESAVTSASIKTINSLDPIKDSAKKAYTALADTEAAQRSLKSLSTRVEYFFSLTNGFLIAQRVIRSAFNTVKELDKAMTDTAVVTDNTISDMWNKLDEYTARANQLGATTQGAYETATLYYQQGLDDQQAGELSVETMKMARIAGMDYAKATDSMTAALRGFNKELTAASAQNVNDVYSNLAAKTASNTQEISTAMEKVASLAHNAGMDLETTAVYLSQAIETTREAPENIGTAMKTILARFQSLTKDPDSLSPEVQEALEGEKVDANVTEAALAKAGVALRDETGQFRAAKDVLLELNAVWNDLDKNTQRYIATQTAGARQQSRFIAMMQNNARTQELLGYAYNSEGASQKQFEKTLDSLEAKINKFKNAWNEFTMGIADSGMIKGAVDILTNLITVVNKLAKMTGPLEGFVKAFIAIGTFKAGGNLLIGGLQQFGLFEDFEKINAKGLAGMMGQFVGKAKSFKAPNKGSISGAIGDTIGNYSVERILAEVGARNANTEAILKEKLANGELTKTRLIELSTQKGSIASKIVSIATTFKETLAAHGLSAALKELAATELSVGAAGSVMLGPFLVVGAALATAGIAIAAYSKSVQNACERAEESIKSFNETKDSINENLNSIEEVRSEFELLRKGVGKNGENIGLSADEFERYHEITNQLAEISPSIVDGYDAEGNAIIRKTNAIQELIDAEKERADLNRRKYVSNSNLSDLITKAREDSKGITEEFNRNTGQMGLAADSGQSFNINDIKDYKEKRDKIVEQIKEKEKEINKITNDPKGDAREALETQLKEQQEQLTILDAQKDATDQLKGAYSDVTDLLTEYTKTLEGGEAILNKYPNILNNALTSIATDTSLDEVGKKQAVQELITNSDFRAATVQMDIFKYKAKQLKEELGDTDAYGDAWNEAYKDASNKIKDFDNLSEDVKEDFINSMASMKDGASELAPTLEEALNPLETAVDAAKNLKETLDKVSENDYFSAGNEIKEGISAATEEEDTWGYGSKTLWEAGFKTLNEDYVKKLQKAGNNEQLIKELKNIDKYMSGEQAANDFYDKLIKDGLMKEAEDGSITIDDIDAISRKYKWDSSTTYAALSNLEQLVGEISYTSSKLPDAIERASNEQNSGVVSNNKEGKKEKYALSKKALQASGATDSQIKSINKDKRYSVFDPSANKGKDILNQLRTFAGIKGNVSTQSETASMFKYYYNMQADIDEAVEATKKLWNTDKIGGDFRKAFQTADGGFDEAKFASAYGDAITSFENPLVDPITDIQANVAKLAGEDPKGDGLNGSENKEPVKPIEQIRAEHQVEAGQKLSEVIKKINIPKPSKKQLDSKIYGGSDGKKQSGKASKIISGLMSKWKEFNTRRATQGIEAKNQTGDGQLAGKLQERIIKFFSPLEKVGDIIDSFIEAIDSIRKKISEIFSGDGILSHFGFGKSSDDSGKGKSKTNISTTVIKVKDKASGITKKIKKEFSKIPDETNTTLKSKDKASSKIKTVKSKADNLNKQKPVIKITAEDKTGSVFSTIRAGITSLIQKAKSLKIGGPKAAKGKNLASSAFGQNILGSAANGAKRGRIGPKGKGGLTLTGELGPELVWEPSKGYSYITGADGPEMRNLSSDAVVWPADQTKKIMRTAANGQNVFGSAAGPKKKVKATAPGKKHNYKGSSTVSTKTTTSKNKGSKNKNKNKNKGKKKNNNKKKQKYIKRLFDRWYNAALRFEKFQKKVELAEKKLENWRQYNFKTFKEVGQQFKDTITNLNNQILQAKAAQTAAKQQRTAAKKAKLRDSDGKVIKKKKISSYVKFDKDGMAYLTTKGLKLKDNKLGNAVKEYIENYNAAWEEEKKWEAQIIDLQKEMIEQLNKERDNYISLLERTRDALVQKIQKQIDKESKIIEAINDANSKLIDSMNKNVSKMRQDRGNKKTEEELQDKYAQLNAMKRIGSGANASDIKKLEKEIKDLEQNYTDTLVDQKISDFQEKNDSASQRKQTAIEIAQALLETRSENGYFNEEAIQMIKDAMADGIYNSDDALWKLLNEAENQNKTAVEIAKHTEEITSLLQGVFNYFNGAVKKGMQTQGYEGQKYGKFVDSKGNETNIIAGKEFTGDGTITAGGKKYTGVTFDTDGKYHYTGVEEVKTTSASSTSKPKSHAHGYLQKVDNKSYKRLSKSDKSYLVKGLNDLIADKKINAKKKDKLSTKVKAAEKKAGVKKPNGTWDAKGAKKIKKKFPKYATGGIADFTGPAWLDGTPSKPELILNAQDSKNFILLKDALSNISSGTVAPSGDNYYDISINVDKLSSDYDVDQVANKIKRMIVNDSKYRGVSSVRRSK